MNPKKLGLDEKCPISSVNEIHLNNKKYQSLHSEGFWAIRKSIRGAASSSPAVFFHIKPHISLGWGCILPSLPMPGMKLLNIFSSVC